MAFTPTTPGCGKLKRPRSAYVRQAFGLFSSYSYITPMSLPSHDAHDCVLWDAFRYSVDVVIEWQVRLR